MITNVVMRIVTTPLQLYRAVFYVTNVFTAYSFVVCLVSSLAATYSINGHKKHTYIEIFSDVIVFSQFDKTVKGSDNKYTDYIKLWVMNLSDVEDAYSDRGMLFVKGKARFFSMPQEFLKYSIDENGRIVFEHWWNNSYGGEDVQLVKVKDYYTLGERILQRIIFCAKKRRISEQRMAEFRERLLSIARKIERKKGLSQKYVEPPRRIPREGIKERKW